MKPSPTQSRPSCNPRPRQNLPRHRRGRCPEASTPAISRPAPDDNDHAITARTANVIALPTAHKRPASRLPRAPLPLNQSPPIWPDGPRSRHGGSLAAGRRRPRSEAPRSRLRPRARARGRPPAHRLLRLARVRRTTWRAGAVMISGTLDERGIHLRADRSAPSAPPARCAQAKRRTKDDALAVTIAPDGRALALPPVCLDGLHCRRAARTSTASTTSSHTRSGRARGAAPGRDRGDQALAVDAADHRRLRRRSVSHRPRLLPAARRRRLAPSRAAPAPDGYVGPRSWRSRPIR